MEATWIYWLFTGMSIFFLLATFVCMYISYRINKFKKDGAIYAIRKLVQHFLPKHKESVEKVIKIVE